MKFQTFDIDFIPRGIVEAATVKEALALAGRSSRTKVAPSVQPYDKWLAEQHATKQIEYPGYSGLNLRH